MSVSVKEKVLIVRLKKKWWWRIIKTVCNNFMAKDNVYVFCQITKIPINNVCVQCIRGTN